MAERSLKNRRLLVLALFVSLACFSLVFAQTGANQEVSSAIGMTLVDDFSNAMSGWPEVENDDMSVHYKGGEYEIKIKKIDWEVYAWPAVTVPADYEIEVEMHLQACNRGYYGIFFNHMRVPDRTYYEFLIYPDNRSFAVWRFYNGLWDRMVKWADTIYLKQGRGTNKLKLVKKGSQIKFYINGELRRDMPFKGLNGPSQAGVCAWAYDEIPTTVHVDNFRATTAGPGEAGLNAQKG